LPEDATSSTLSNWIKKAQDNPNILIESIVGDNAATVRDSWQRRIGPTGGTPKQIAEAKQELFSERLPLYIQKQVLDGIEANIKSWNSPALAAGTPLAQAIADVSKTHKDGKAPISAVIDTIIDKKLTNPDGTLMTFQQKSQLITQALDDHTNLMPKNIIINAEMVEGVRNQLSNKLKNMLGKAHSRAMIWGRDTELGKPNTLGFGTLNPTQVF
jgi:hypothetical protein